MGIHSQNHMGSSSTKGGVKKIAWKKKWLEGLPEHLSQIYPEVIVDARYIKDLIHNIPLAVKNGALYHEQYSGPFVTVRNGFRRTTNQPRAYANTIHLLGPSYTFSIGSEDKHTIASYLQRRCNYFQPETYRVLNHGVKATRIANCYLQLLSLKLIPGDYVILIDQFKRNKEHPFELYLNAMNYMCKKKNCFFLFFLYPLISRMQNPSHHEKRLNTYSYEQLFLQDIKGVPPEQAPVFTLRKSFYDRQRRELLKQGYFYDLQPLVERPHAHGELFLDKWHLANKGNELIADIVYQKLQDATTAVQETEQGNLLLRRMKKSSIAFLAKTLREQYADNSNIVEWLSSVPRPACTPPFDIGCIVMNCNPFTQGHLHLIREAMRHVKTLFIFVVQEDKSVFPFEDRFRLIKQGTEEFGTKVIVVPSGLFIISSFSFPEYFAKDSIQTSVDPSMDVALFGSIIAPALAIRTRFVGEEPFCKVTRKYNRLMRRLLPSMGIRVQVIPRLEEGGEVISASRVRSLLNSGDMDAVRQMVPQCTYEYLWQHGNRPLGELHSPKRLFIDSKEKNHGGE